MVRAVASTTIALGLVQLQVCVPWYGYLLQGTANGYHQQYHLPPGNGDGSEDEAESSLLQEKPDGPLSGPFDDPHSRGVTPPVRPASHYSLSETYASDHAGSTGTYNEAYRGGIDNYPGSGHEDAAAMYGVPDRTQSPYSRSETSSTEAWRQRQLPAGNGLRRYATRKVNLGQGSVLSVDYPVPSAIQNAVQSKYRSDLEGGSEEFTHMRCKQAKSRRMVWVSIVDISQIPQQPVIPTSSPSRMAIICAPQCTIGTQSFSLLSLTTMKTKCSLHGHSMVRCRIFEIL